MSESARSSGKIVPLPTGVSVFGPFRFDRRTGRLSRADAEIHLTPRASAVLRCLIGRPGAVVSKDELFEQVWKDVNVTDDALLQVVSALRKALGDDPRRPEYIQTVTGEGYRFIAEVAEAGVETMPAAALGSVAAPQPFPPAEAASPPRATPGAAAGGAPWRRRGLAGALMLALIAATLAGAALIDGGAGRWLGADATRSIAVLPFANLSGDPGQDYFSDGLAEELIVKLSEIDGLRVMARTSSFAFRGQDRDVREIGERLDVGHVLEGSARRQGDRVRVTARLIDAASGFELWSNVYDRAQTDLFSIQQDIAARVAEALTLPLLGESASRVAKLPTADLEAYDAYLQGKYLLARYSIDALRAAANNFQRAIDLDPDFALAYVGLADSYLLRNRYGVMEMDETLAGAEPAIDRALQLDGSLGEAHAMRGFVLQRQGRIEEAQRAYEHAIELNPDSARTYQLYFWMTFVRESSTERTHELAMKALAADPLSPVVQENVGWWLFEAGRRDEALPYFEKSIALEPDYPYGYSALGLYYRGEGDMDASIAAFDKAVALSPQTTLFRGNLGRALASVGRVDEAVGQQQRVVAQRPSGAHYGELAQIYWDAGGRPDEAVRWYEQGIAIDDGDPRLRTMLALTLLDLGDAAGAEEQVAAAEAVAPDNYLTQLGRLNMLLYQGRVSEGANLARELAETARFLGDLAQIDRPYYEYEPLGYISLLAGRPDDALVFPTRAYPRLLDDEPRIDYFSIDAAIDLAAILMQTGDDGRAQLLLERSLAFIESQTEGLRRTRYREEPAEIYALQGRIPEALAAFREAIDNGWRRGWWRARSKPHYAILRDRPEFRAMLEELAAEATSRRAALGSVTQ